MRLKHFVGWCVVGALLSAGSLWAADLPLVEAVKKGDAVAVRALLKQGTNRSEEHTSELQSQR